MEPFGKDLINTLDGLIQSLCDQTSGKNVIEKSIRFIPNDTLLNLKPEDLGYFTVANFFPSDLRMELCTPILAIETGSKVKFSINCMKEIPTEVFQFLKCSVSLYPGVNLPVEYGSTGFDFSFDLSVPGRYQVSVTLYDQQIEDSPMMLPVSECAKSNLYKIGLAVIDEEESKSDLVKLGPVTGQDDYIGISADLKSTDIISSSDVDQKTNDEICSPSKWTVGLACIAKWSEDCVWYRGKIENIENDFCTVSFVDYGNNDIIKIDSIVETVEEIPKVDKIKGMIDEHVNCLPVIHNESPEDVHVNCLPVILEESPDVLSDHLESQSLEEDNRISKPALEVTEGLICIAKWPEDDVWYNARVDQVLASDIVKVTFTDYDNSEEIPSQNLISCFNDIPAEEIDFVDEHVDRCDGVPVQVSF